LTEQKARKILIIDGHSLAHRAFHALPHALSRADGTPTNAVLGFCNMMVKLLEQEQRMWGSAPSTGRRPPSDI
jgi:5'-3' exonuclease